MRSHRTNSIRKGINPTIPSPSMTKHSRFGWQPFLEKENFDLKLIEWSDVADYRCFDFQHFALYSGYFPEKNKNNRLSLSLNDYDTRYPIGSFYFMTF